MTFGPGCVLPTQRKARRMSTRLDSHAGSWYSDDEAALRTQIAKLIEQGESGQKGHPAFGSAKAVIVPHAGIRFSGATAANSYSHLGAVVAARPEIRRIVLLGPSHHVSLQCCAIPASTVRFYRTPFGDIALDIEALSSLLRTDVGPHLFERLSIEDDENEHSLEMQLPFLHYVMSQNNRQWQLVPILVGSIGVDSESTRQVANALLPLFEDPGTLFVISSDFCHWGKRFGFTYWDKQEGELWQSITALDKMGMEAAQTLDIVHFGAYIKKYKNTICGRHPIAIHLELARLSRTNQLKLDFVFYAQSSKCVNSSDSSVSYAAAVLYPQPQNEDSSCR